MTTRRGAGAGSRRHRWGTLAVLAVTMVVAGCSSGSDSGVSTMSADLPASDSAGSADEAVAQGEDLSSTIGAAAAERSVIVNGAIVLTADEPIAVAGLIVTAVEGAGGYLDGRSESEGSGQVPAQARLTVRVPPGEVQPMIDSLRGIGEVTSVDLTSSDVTTQVADLETRISAKKVAITRLEELLSGAGSMADLLAVEGELTSRQSELEQLLTEQAGIDDLTAMATIEISVYATDQEPEPENDETDGFLGGLSTGWGALVAALGVAVTVVGVLLPWLVLVAVLGAVVLAVRRGLRRRTTPAQAATPRGPVTLSDGSTSTGSLAPAQATAGPVGTTSSQGVSSPGAASPTDADGSSDATEV